MKRTPVSTTVLIAASIGAWLLWKTNGDAKEHTPLSLDGSPIDWQPDLPTALEVAARTKKPLMVLFRCEP